ncbi:hypothetical protein V496_09626 [Pseudogymnoascus sp. VKM F-4515 (FW-2607)]|nr:hypothetical protein V496_09626 [Pseudogymnoascus sp. VKM F-4515 (FW-2607)]
MTTLVSIHGLQERVVGVFYYVSWRSLLRIYQVLNQLLRASAPDTLKHASKMHSRQLRKSYVGTSSTSRFLSWGLTVDDAIGVSTRSKGWKFNLRHNYESVFWVITLIVFPVPQRDSLWSLNPVA